MAGNSQLDQIQRGFAEFVEEFNRVKDEAASSDTLIASAEYELDLLKQDFAFARLSHARWRRLD